MKVVWIPRRHRSLVYKLLILIPVAWLTIAFLYYNGRVDGVAGNALPNALQQHQNLIQPSESDENAAVSGATNAKIIDRYLPLYFGIWGFVYVFLKPLSIIHKCNLVWWTEEGQTFVAVGWGGNGAAAVATTAA